MLSPQSQVKIQSVDVAQNIIKYSHQPFAISRQGAPSYSEFRENAQWSISENAKYVAFLEKNFIFMDKKMSKPLWFVYEQMGKYIKTRNFRQCKLHHQRMIQKYGSARQIISSLSFLIKERDVVKKIEIERKRPEHREQVFQEYQNSKGKGCVSTAPNYSEQIQQGYEKSRMQQWYECHKLFVEWTKRLSLLMLPKMYV